LTGKLLEHLEAALAIADETQDEEVRLLVQRTIDLVRTANWPRLDPNLEVFRRGR
jgi:hypothetical protein